MQARLYLNNSTGVISKELDSTPFQFPTIPLNEDIILKFNLAETNGKFVELSPAEVVSASARIGNYGLPAESGAYQLVINPPEAAGNVTADISAGATADEVRDLINDLDGPALDDLLPCTVIDQYGVFRVVFADKTADVRIEVAENSLWPTSFVNVEEQEWDEGNLYLISHRQASGTATATLGTRAPDLPVVERVQPGSSEDGTIVNEIQSLTIPASYAGGTFQLERGGEKSDLIPLPTSDEALAAAVLPLRDTGGSFRIWASSKSFYVEFSGEMGGTPQELLSVIPFDPPANDYYLKLKTRTAGMSSLMRRAAVNGELELPLHIQIQTRNELEPEELDNFAWQTSLTFTLPPDDGSNNVSTELVWNQPRSRADVLPHSKDSVIVGHRSYSQKIGDTVSTSFPIPHNLGNNAQEVTADPAADQFTAVDHNFHNLDPITIESDDEWPAPLVEGQTVWVTERTPDTFKVSERAGGPAIDLTTAGAGTLTARMNDGSSGGFHVTVFETAGNRARVPDNSYTVELTSEDLLTVRDFPEVPTANQYTVHVTTIGRPATYQELELPQERVIGLVDRLLAAEARLSVLEELDPKEFVRVNDETAATAEEWALPTFAEIYPQQGRSAAVLEPDTPLSTITPESLPRVAPAIYPAVHTDSTPALPVIDSGDGLIVPADAIADNRGKVYENTQASPVLIPIGTGFEIPAGGFAASDGVSWYPVEQYGPQKGNSFYPAHLSRTLWQDSIESDQLRKNREFAVKLSVEVAAFKANTPVYGHFVIETAQLTEDEGDAAPNLKALDWSETLRLDQRVTLTKSPRTYVFGYKVWKDSAGTLGARALKFGKWSAASTPGSSRFAIRFRFIKVDTANAVPDPVALIAYRGPHVETLTPDESSPKAGFAYVK